MAESFSMFAGQEAIPWKPHDRRESSGRTMHPVIQFFVFWALAFVSLCAALVLLAIYYSLIGNDLTLRSLGQEAIIAGIASLIEGGSVWLVFTYVPAGARALFIPALAVAVLYKLSHLEDWSRYDVALFLVFQFVITSSGVSLFFGHVQSALIILAVFGAILAVVASISKSL
jgi:hypothetical protein